VIVAAIPLHYGAEYLRQAVEAVEPFVGRVVVLYTPHPSYGHSTVLPCPDSEESLRACCDGVAHKLTWKRGEWAGEGQHRNEIYNLCPDADLILQVDADEVWDQPSLLECIEYAETHNYRNLLIDGFVHFWRSFRWACRDVWAPVRIIKPGGDGNHTIPGRVYHFGYAQGEAITRYKWTCHGHQNELRPEWFDSIFMDPERKRDLHPVVKDWWNAEPFDRAKLPESLQKHPYFFRDLI